MRTERLLEATINIEDPIGATADPNYVINTLKKIYEGKCYSRCLILKILRVEKPSYCSMDSMKKRHMGSVSVKFTAKVLTCNTGDILHGCEVVKVDQGRAVLCKYKELSISAQQQGILKLATRGQLVSVVVTRVAYQLSESTIFVEAGPYTRSAVSVYYAPFVDPKAQTSPENSPVVIAAKTMLTKAIDKANKTRDTMGKAWAFFEGMYYPFKAPVKPPGIIKKLEEIAVDGIVSRCVQLQGQAEYVLVDECPPGDELVVTLTAEQIMVTLLLDYVAYLRLIRRSCELYSTRERLDAHKNIFAAIKLAKI